jgi:hypothetical protein
MHAGLAIQKRHPSGPIRYLRHLPGLEAAKATQGVDFASVRPVSTVRDGYVSDKLNNRCPRQHIAACVQQLLSSLASVVSLELIDQVRMKGYTSL